MEKDRQAHPRLAPQRVLVRGVRENSLAQPHRFIMEPKRPAAKVAYDRAIQTYERIAAESPATR